MVDVGPQNDSTEATTNCFSCMRPACVDLASSVGTSLGLVNFLTSLRHILYSEEPVVHRRAFSQFSVTPQPTLMSMAKGWLAVGWSLYRCNFSHRPVKPRLPYRTLRRALTWSSDRRNPLESFVFSTALSHWLPSIAHCRCSVAQTKLLVGRRSSTVSMSRFRRGYNRPVSQAFHPSGSRRKSRTP